LGVVLGVGVFVGGGGGFFCVFFGFGDPPSLPIFEKRKDGGREKVVEKGGGRTDGVR